MSIISLLSDWEKKLDREAQDRKKLRAESIPRGVSTQLGEDASSPEERRMVSGALGLKARFLQPAEGFGAEAPHCRQPPGAAHHLTHVSSRVNMAHWQLAAVPSARAPWGGRALGQQPPTAELISWLQ